MPTTWKTCFNENSPRRNSRPVEFSSFSAPFEKKNTIWLIHDQLMVKWRQIVLQIIYTKSDQNQCKLGNNSRKAAIPNLRF